MAFRELGKKHKENIILLVILIISLISLSIQSGRFSSIPERVGLGITSAIQSVFTSIQTFFTRTIRSVSELRDLREEYDALLEKLEESQQVFTSVAALQEENKLLRETLEYSKSLDFRNTPAQIIGKDPGVVFNSFLINKGGGDGIATNMPVVGYQNGKLALVGKVLQVSWGSSLVRPLVDPQSYVAARLTHTRYEGLVRGLGSQKDILLMEYLDREARNQISVGDEVITSGLNSVYPPNLRIGVVSAISATSYDTSLALEVVPFTNYTSLEQVYVLQGSIEMERKRQAPFFIQNLSAEDTDPPQTGEVPQ